MKFSAGILLAFLGLTNGFVSQQSASARLGATELFERKAFITGNWKLNPSTKQEAITLAQGIAQAATADSPCDIALFVPFVFLETVKNIVGDKLLVGAEVGKSLFCLNYPE